MASLVTKSPSLQSLLGVVTCVYHGRKSSFHFELRNHENGVKSQVHRPLNFRPMGSRAPVRVCWRTPGQETLRRRGNELGSQSFVGTEEGSHEKQALKAGRSCREERKAMINIFRAISQWAQEGERSGLGQLWLRKLCLGGEASRKVSINTPVPTHPRSSSGGML